ncbi:LPD25 domain-containing protein [Vibrio lentus]|uniref:LPD25 domain-containing protein n=1 Tax=Vibrio lentus TaxID=136468 RepID=UPI000C8333C9|nr:LPD25 domain-containing protein [Vibrio lentus]PMG66738.1 hypothetical protein BCU86_12745 [Vibrio lentus]PMI07833.1 hypothetical protein BCU53_10005 [Vibrio lentus]
MSHSLFLQTHSTKPAKASNVSPLHPSGSTTMKVAPLSVLIHWSESSRLQTDEEFEFEIFEAIALKAALDNQLGGYDKTEITVTFEGGHQHRCRVDLGCGGNECGFADHCFRVLEYALSLEKSDPSHWYFTHAQGRELLALLKTYQLNRHSVALVRSQVLARTRLAKAQQEAEEQAKAEQRKAAHQQQVEREKAFHASLCIPDWAQGAIVATYTVFDEENSDPYGDDYRFNTEKTIVLAWSKHTRRLFPELRRACLNHEDTAFLADKAQSSEHRENYSMGAGTYLTNKDFIRCGWSVRKVRFWREASKAVYVPLGELAQAVQA